ncbi:chemotaxis protein CheW [Aureispira anguillae]|uniref:Chemotaxis protein CheW n=1 Tax=Aureispira anguillae TaxID=2864201 RepID=A0A915YB23_9BACT|nr:chemotaxis protein CheW [Aureispira anguillae]BDS09778.1 chemotaxis protein CheW [Aureispira anguillae]
MSDKTEYTIEDVKREAANHQQNKEQSELMQLIIFKLGGEEYGLSIDQIKEVVLTPKVAKMPQTPPYIKGVANIRGTIIAIMDLEQKFGLGEEQEEEQALNYTLVVENETVKVGILVKEVPNTLTIEVDDIDKASTLVQYSSLDASCLIGVVNVGERMIILMDMIKLIETEGVKTSYT